MGTQRKVAGLQNPGITNPELAKTGQLVAVDPGTMHMGVAVFDQGVLARAELVNAHRYSLCEAADLVARCCKDTHGARCVIENQHVILGRTKRPQDIITLAQQAGAVAHALWHEYGHEVEFVQPQAWKGGRSKSATKEKARLVLGDDELLLTVGVRHDVWDAIGIGLWALGRFDRRRVFPRG